MDAANSISPPAPTRHSTLKGLRNALRNKAKKVLNFRAQVVSVQGTKGVFADETGQINFVSESIALTKGKTYELTGTLSVEFNSLTVHVITATLASNEVTSVGVENLSLSNLDPKAFKPIVTIEHLLNNRIGMSFYARARKIEKSSSETGKVSLKAVLGDQTASINAFVSANRNISEEVLNEINEDTVYLCSDVILKFNASNQLEVHFNGRSHISIASSEAQISAISVLNLSNKIYSEEEKNAITIVLDLPDPSKVHEPRERKPRVKKVAVPASTQTGLTSAIKKRASKPRKPLRKNFYPDTSPVTISQLEAWNSNQTFQGKILSLNAVHDEKRDVTFLKGQVADNTGVIDFDLAQKKKQPVFAVNQVVLFEKVMNKQSKSGRHCIDVKKLGTYTILEDAIIDDVNTANNLSDKALPTRSQRVVLPQSVEHPERVERERPLKKTREQSTRQPREQEKQTPQPKAPREPRAPKEAKAPREQRERVIPVATTPVKVSELVIRNNTQSVIGKVLSVSEETRAPREGTEQLAQVHLVGQIADETGAVEFDLIKQEDKSIAVGDFVLLDLVMNLVSRGRHLVQIRSLGKYSVVSGVAIDSIKSEVIALPPRVKKEPREKTQETPQSRSQQAPLQSSQRKQAAPKQQQSNTNNGNNERSSGNNERQSNNSTRDNASSERAPRHNNNENNYIAKPQQSQKFNDVEISAIAELVPGQNGQNIIGEVFNVEMINTKFGDKTVKRITGRIADKTGNIQFSLPKRSNFEIKDGTTYKLLNVMNRVSEQGFHSLQIGKHGKYFFVRKSGVHDSNKRDGEENNRSSIEYEKSLKQ